MSVASLPGVYNERFFRGVDYAIAQAARHGIKVIVALNNYWENSDSVGNVGATSCRWCHKSPLVCFIAPASMAQCAVCTCGQQPALL